jgi:acyl-lipid omega-6 desaturase (Delta-12 desaturase)
LELRRISASYAHPTRWQGLLQLPTSFGPFLLSCAAMYWAYPTSEPLSLVLALPTGVLLVRVFIVQHDCGHGSFFASRRANQIVGRLCSLFTLTPFAYYTRQHALHHADWNNLELSGGSDIYSVCLTVQEYLARSRWRRLLYRLPRHPLVANILLPPLIIVLLFRVPFDTPRTWIRERRSVYLTNAALAVVFGALVALVGWREVLMVHLPVMIVASIFGFWLVSLQHRFETARWMAGNDWTFVAASLDGSSWLSLPGPLNWLSGNIGFHHVHHLNPHVPNYRLRAAHDAVQALRPTPPLSLRRGLSAPWLTLWDETAGRLVRFRDARARPARLSRTECAR